MAIAISISEKIEVLEFLGTTKYYIMWLYGDALRQHEMHETWGLRLFSVMHPG